MTTLVIEPGGMIWDKKSIERNEVDKKMLLLPLLDHLVVERPLIRCLNRMHEMIPGASARGQAILDGIDIYDSNVDPVTIKRRIGMVFQKPNPFSTMSIYDNVAAGVSN